jgi:hypothetical protein
MNVSNSVMSVQCNVMLCYVMLISLISVLYVVRARYAL